jgi:hypothetical protein
MIHDFDSMAILLRWDEYNINYTDNNINSDWPNNNDGSIQFHSIPSKENLPTAKFCSEHYNKHQN